MSRADNLALLRRFREVGILLFILVVGGVASVAAPRFLLPENLRNILLNLPLLVITAMGMTGVIISRNIDLSVGSTLGLCGMVVGLLFKSNPHFPIVLGVLIGVALGVVLGAVNGALVTTFRIPAIIATLATLSIYRGLVFWVSGGKQVDPNDVPTALVQFAQPSRIGVSGLIILALLIAVAAHGFLRYQRIGREIFAVGNNPIAARLRGIRVNRAVFAVFVLTGGLAGLAGVMSAALFDYVNPAATGVGFELTVIAATVIGGTNVYGGAGSVGGTLLGCLLLGVIENALVVTGLSGTWQLAIYGAIILIAVLFDSILRSRLDQTAEGTA